MSLLCSKCGDKAHFLCGHGCGTAYCAEPCALVSYEVHKTECAALVGGATAEEILRRVSGGSPQQRYQSLYTQFQFLQQAMTQHRNLNMIQKRFNKGNITAHIQAFLQAANVLYHQPDMNKADVLNLINWVNQYAPLTVNSEIGEEAAAPGLVSQEEEIGEGVVDIFDSADRYYNYFNTDNTMARINHVRDVFAQMESTYDKHKKSVRGKIGFKGKLEQRLGYLIKALQRLKERPGLPNDEKQLYTQYERQAQIWQRDL